MRNTTIVLALGLLLGATAIERHHKSERAEQTHHRKIRAERAQEELRNPELARLREQMGAIDSRLKGTKDTVSALDRHESSIQGLIRQAHRDRQRALKDNQDREIARIYNQSLADLERQLTKIRQEKALVQGACDRLSAERFALKAKHDMKRVLFRNSEESQWARSKPDPIELLTEDQDDMRIRTGSDSPVLRILEF